MVNPESGNQQLSKKDAELLRRQQQNREKQADSPSRRSFLKLGLVAGITVLGGGAAALLRGRTSEPHSQEASTTVEDRLQELAALSERLKAPYAVAKSHMEKFLHVVEQANISKEMAHRLIEPLAFFVVNEENQYRDLYQLQMQDIRKRGQDSLTTATEVMLEKGAYFSMSLKQPQDTDSRFYLAAFSSYTRDLVISEQLAPDSTIDGLAVYHELVHAAQDYHLREKLKSKDDFEVYKMVSLAKIDGRPVFNIADEQDAYLRQIELFNVITDGAFKRDCLSGMVKEADYISRYGGKNTENHATIQMMLQLGELLYTTGQQQMDDAIERTYAQYGLIARWRDAKDLYSVQRTLYHGK